MRKQQEASMKGISGRVRFSSTSFFLLVAFWSKAADAQMLVHFDLPAQPLAQSLNAIGTATNTDVGYRASLVAGLLAPPLKADLTVDGALTRVLVGTGLRPKHLDDHTILITATGALTADSRERRLFWAKASSATEQGDQIVPSQAGAATTDNPSSSNAGKKDLDEIVVTGTHIHGTDNKINPIITIDQDQIERSGYSSTSDLFRALPQNFQSVGANPDGFLSGTHAAGYNKDFASGIDLRGLGPSSTLVLVNGHRLAPSSFGSFVDVSQIPLAAIDRVEILTDGSSAIYGSDAVGGVVNIILKKDYQGADSTVRYGATTGGGRDEVLASQTMGSNWPSGNAVGTLQYQRQGALPAADRTFASNLTVPNDLFPKNQSYGLTLDGRQTLLDGLEFNGDVLVSKRQFTQFSSIPTPPLGNYDDLTNGNTQSVSVSPGLRYNLTPKWTVELSGLYGQQKSLSNLYEDVPGFPFTNLNLGFNNRFTEKSIDLVMDGRFGSTSAGDIAVAFGGSYRTEDLDSVITQTSGGSVLITPREENRHVRAEFGELHIPIVGPGNRIPLVQALELSLAVRRDNYSDFGSTTNPHVGLRWAPLADVSLRGSYGKSFRAPNGSEEITKNTPAYIFNYDVSNPAGPGLIPALILAGGKTLSAERARTLNFGVQYSPLNFQGFTASLDYYDIRYADRIVEPPIAPNVLQQPTIYGSLISPVASDAAAQAIVNAVTAAGGQFFDEIGTGATGVRYLYDARQQNAAVVLQSGLDLTSKLTRSFGAYTWTSQLNVAFIDKIETQFAQGSNFFNQVNTFASPAKWRTRLDSTWGGAAFSLSGALNFVGSYVDTNAVGNPSIASWTTADLNATLNVETLFQSYGWRGLSFSIVLLNVFDRNPPFVATSIGGTGYPISYDSANANPLGRFIAVTLRKKW
jgi:outer membrane receptor protein involved in Fe transport